MQKRLSHPKGVRDKISLFCDVEEKAVIPLITVPSIYQVPVILEDEGLGRLVVERLNLKTGAPDLSQWQELITRLTTPREAVNVALVGKYVELKDAYYSVRESLCHAALCHNKSLNLTWIQSEDIEKNGNLGVLRNAQGIIVPGGFGVRGIEGMVKTARYARENKVPYLGLCLGMQVMVIDFGRHVLGNDSPNSSEFDPNTPHPVIDYLVGQKNINKMGGTMRLGNYPCHLVPGSRAAKAYGVPAIQERHRHRLEFNNKYRELLGKAGMVFSGLSPDGELVEICEISDHPWMLGCQFHPEFGSRPGRPHPLFRDFIGVAKDVMREGAQPSLALTP